VLTIPDISPTFNPKLASSNGLCMAPLPKYPRSPLFLYDEQSLLAAACEINHQEIVAGGGQGLRKRERIGNPENAENM
jgi:hypothetical protein